MKTARFNVFMLLAALLAACPVVLLAAVASQVPASVRATEDPVGSTTEAGAPAQPPAQLPAYRTASSQREGGAIERSQDALAQSVVEVHKQSKQEESAAPITEQAAWQRGQAAQQAVPLPAALRQQVAQRLQQVPASGVAGQQGEVTHSTEQQRYEEEEPSEAVTSADASGEDDSAEPGAEARAERHAEAERQARLQAAEDELQEAEELVGWARDEADVDVPRGIALLEAMSARLDGMINAALEESTRQRQRLSPPQVPVEQKKEQAAVRSDSDGAAGEAAGVDGAVSTEAAAGDASAGTAELTSGSEAFAVADAAADEAGEGGLANDAAPVGSDAASASASVAGASTATDAHRQQQQAQQALPVHMPSALAMDGLDLDPYEHPELAPLSDAAVTLAALLSSGIAAPHGLRSNDSRAVHVLHQAAAAGSLEARVALADRYLSGRGVPRLPEEGLRHAKVAGPELLALLDEAGAVSGNEGAALRLQFMDASYQPAGAGWDDTHTLQYERSLAERGDVEARRQLGYRLLTGQGVARDLPGAFRHFQAAAAGGDPYAQFNLGYMHVRGLHVPQNYSAARDHFLQAAAKQLPAAINGLGVLHFHGQGVPANHTEAARYFAMAADHDHDAAFNLATMSQGGYGVERNMSLAIELFHNSTELGSWRAPHQLFLVLADGLYDAPRNASQAAAAFWRFMSLTSGWRDGGKQAAERFAEGDAWGAALRYALLAEQGDPSAMLNLAWLLHRGGVHAGPDRHALALPLWLRAAERNYSEGALLAGHAYRQGSRLGLAGGTDLPAAAELYQQAAAAGSAEGLFSLGRMRELGRGLERNASEAARLYRLAIAAAPYEAYAAAPFLALQWLRLRVLLAPLLRLGELLLLPMGSIVSTGCSAASDGAATPAAHGQRQQLQRRSRGLLPPAQWDTLLIAAMVGALTWVLWRKRQLQQRIEPASALRPTGVWQLPVQQQEAEHLAAAAQQRRQQQREEPHT